MNNGYRIMDRNWKLKNSYELDIIAFKDNLIHFIEVKTRDRSSGSNPLTAIDKRKLFHIYRAGMLYKKYYRLNFDSVMHAISIVYGSDTDYELKFIPNIHQAMTAMGYYSHKRH
jgi:putative endonuclease